jgi:hypothetical protein
MTTRTRTPASHTGTAEVDLDEETVLLVDDPATWPKGERAVRTLVAMPAYNEEAYIFPGDLCARSGPCLDFIGDSRYFPKGNILAAITPIRRISGTIVSGHLYRLHWDRPQKKPLTPPCRTPPFPPQNRVVFNALSLRSPEPYRHLFTFIHGNLILNAAAPGPPVWPAAALFISTTQHSGIPMMQPATPQPLSCPESARAAPSPEPTIQSISREDRE